MEEIINFDDLQTMFKSTVTAPQSEQMDASVNTASTSTSTDPELEEVSPDVPEIDVQQIIENIENASKQVDMTEVCEAATNDLNIVGENIPHELTLKHPLQNVWTLWYLENDRTKSWEDMQNEITSFDTVEDFWSLYNHIKPPSEIKLGSDYSLFKKGIRPMWEDAANNNGGRWVIALNKMLKEDLDKLWLDVLLCLIGEVFDRFDEICGAVVNIRGKSNKISIWTANGNNKEAILEIGHKLRDALRLGPETLLQYQLHKDAMVKQGSNVKSTFTL